MGGLPTLAARQKLWAAFVFRWKEWEDRNQQQENKVNFPTTYSTTNQPSLSLLKTCYTFLRSAGEIKDQSHSLVKAVQKSHGKHTRSPITSEAKSVRSNFPCGIHEIKSRGRSTLIAWHCQLYWHAVSFWGKGTKCTKIWIGITCFHGKEKPAGPVHEPSVYGKTMSGEKHHGSSL